MRVLLILVAFVMMCASVESAPFFDAIYDALNGNGRRSYGYGGYGYYGYKPQPRREPSHQRSGVGYKELCRVHHPDSIGTPGAGGIICPY